MASQTGKKAPEKTAPQRGQAGWKKAGGRRGPSEMPHFSAAAGPWLQMILSPPSTASAENTRGSSVQHRGPS